MGASDAPVTVLVVDDNPPTRYSTSRVLRGAGFTVIEAATGSDALVKGLQDPDAIILDVHLPDIDGLEVCRRLRATPRTARTPIIHLSAAFVKEDDKVQGLDAGADGYLIHPVEPPVLIATVNAFLRTRRAEDAMRASEAKFKAVFDNAPNGIALLDEAMIYVDVNAAMSRTLGSAREDIIGRHIGAFIPTDAADIIGEVNRELESAGLWRGTFPVRHTAGANAYLDWNIVVQADLRTRLAVTTDITRRTEIDIERERLLASERAARGDAERANRLKDEFLASVSHELRTPLNAIIGWTRLLGLDDQGKQPSLRKGLQAIERSVRAQTQMIADLLDVSRITTGKVHLERQRFDPATAIEAALTAFMEPARAKELTITVEMGAGVGELVWDLTRFQQVVTNLVDNAIKFTEPGGTIALTATGTPAAVQLVIRDSGRGIDAEFLPFVFDRFRQEDASSRRRHGGLGLGLAIVKQLVEAHEGTIAVDSPGERLGTTFTITLPRLHRDDTLQDAALTPPSSLEGVRVLVVEDDADAREMVARVLREFHAEVTETSSVAEARRALQHFTPHLIVSDISMPVEDGYDLIRYLRAPGSEFAATPAIALTAFARDEDRHRTLEAGYQIHMTKPVEPLKLVAIARTLTHDE